METIEQIKHSYHLKVDETYEKTFPVVAKFVSRAGGSFDDAKDIFHDAMVIFLEKKSTKKVDFIQSEGAYILGISKHLWIRKYKNEKKKTHLNGLESEIEVPADYFPTPDNKRLLRFLRVAGEKCLNLLRAFYFQQSSITEIAEDFGYQHPHSASVQKYKCLEKVRNTVKERSLTYEEFTA